MRTIILSDCHIGSKESNYRLVKRFLAFLPRCDELVLLGDFWDLWDMSADRLRERHGDVIMLLDRICAAGTKITYVLGNHDEAYLEDPVMPEGLVEVVEGPYVLPNHPKSIVAIHGHEYDPVYQDHRWLSRGLAWVNMMLVRTIGISVKSLARSTCTDCKDRDDFHDLVWRIHGTAANANRHHDVLVMGHTHTPTRIDASTFGVEVVNPGDWKWSNTWVEVVNGDVGLNRYD